MTKPKTIHIISLGCPKNLIDSEVMGGLLSKSGLQIVPRRELADIVIVNTCAFINPAKEEALEEILLLAREKKEGSRQFRLVVAGCLAQRYGQQLLAEIPEVDLYVGTGEVGNITSPCKLAYAPRMQSVPPLSPNLIF